jgi:tetratricopeptide (TPR) repeat protein
MMRKIVGILLLLSAWSAGAEFKTSCTGCSMGKEKLQCDYYVAERGDKSRQEQCRIYAEYVNIDGAYPKAAWYYLLAGDVEKALETARKGVTQGQEYGGEYLAMALWIRGEREEAKKVLQRFFSAVPEHDYFDRDLKTLRALYPGKDLRKLRP